MSEAINEKVKSKISEDLSPTKNLTGLHLKLLQLLQLYGHYFNFGMLHHFLFGLILECLKGFQQELFI